MKFKSDLIDFLEKHLSHKIFVQEIKILLRQRTFTCAVFKYIEYLTKYEGYLEAG
jgi:hypothetical protein